MNVRRSVCIAFIFLLSGSLSGCVGIGSTILTSVASAAIKTAIEQSQKAGPSPEQLWHDAQIAGLEQRAVSGDVEAQYQLGTYYLTLREPRGADWICQASIQGHGRAQLQYGHFFNEDRKSDDLYPFVGITPNNVEAFVWYSLSDRSGEPRAAVFRDSLTSGRMSRENRDQAEAALQAWAPSACSDVSRTTTVATTGIGLQPQN